MLAQAVNPVKPHKDGDAISRILAAFGVSARELLLTIPRAYHWLEAQDLQSVVEGERATLVGRVGEWSVDKKERISIIATTLTTPNGPIKLKWVSHPKRAHLMQYTLKGSYPTGSTVIASGKVAVWGKSVELSSPDVEVAPEWLAAQRAKGHAIVLPVYSLVEGVKQHEVRQAVRELLNSEKIKTVLPSSVEVELNLPALDVSLRGVHGLIGVPADRKDELIAGTSRAHRRVLCEPLYEMMSRLPGMTGARATAPSINVDVDGIKSLLPFALTGGEGSQSEALSMIASEIGKPVGMRRLLQGDVGCGKSAVAFLSAVSVAKAGHQVAVMAPTDILAGQLYLNCERIATAAGIKTYFVNGKLKAKQLREVEQAARSGEPVIFVGTHSIANLEYTKLGLLVIDEEHRFGVKLKDQLLTHSPHLLVMSATPIPRSVSLTMYAGYSVSSITVKPPGRKPVKTKLFLQGNENSVYAAAKDQIEKKRQVFVVCPAIELNEQMASVATYGEQLKAYFGEDQVRTLHGGLSKDESDSVIDSFRKNEFGCLVATTIVEVGVDIPNSTIMIIVDPQRFGLAQLHQLRGRVGRGDLPGGCMLMATRPLNADSVHRLDFFSQTNDGFALAEEDVRLRGTGELDGTKQTGFGEVNLLVMHKEASTIYNYFSAKRAPVVALANDDFTSLEL